jgi:hypothetical protein
MMVVMVVLTTQHAISSLVQAVTEGVVVTWDVLGWGMCAGAAWTR